MGVDDPGQHVAPLHVERLRPPARRRRGRRRRRSGRRRRARRPRCGAVPGRTTVPPPSRGRTPGSRSRTARSSSSYSRLADRAPGAPPRWPSRRAARCWCPVSQSSRVRVALTARCARAQRGVGVQRRSRSPAPPAPRARASASSPPSTMLATAGRRSRRRCRAARRRWSGASTKITSAPAVAVALRRARAPPRGPRSARASVRAMISVSVAAPRVDGGADLAAPSRRRRSTALPAKCPHFLGKTWSSSWIAAAPARSSRRTVRVHVHRVAEAGVGVDDERDVRPRRDRRDVVDQRVERRPGRCRARRGASWPGRRR